MRGVFVYRVFTRSPDVLCGRNINYCRISISVLGIVVPIRWPDKIIGTSFHRSTHLDTITSCKGIGILNNSHKVQADLVRIGAEGIDHSLISK
jgi:hypothetical protein